MTVKQREAPFNFGVYAGVYPWIATCEEFLCYWSTAHKTEDEAKKILVTHTCPHRGPRRYNVKGKAIIEKLWDELDSEFDVIYQMMQDKNEDTKWNSGRVRGIAWCIVQMAGPYYTEVDQVMRQGKKRYQMRNKEIEFEPTPTYDYQPPPPGDAHPKPKAAPTTAILGAPSGPKLSASEKRSVDKLSPETKEAIKKALDMKMLSEAEASRNFGISVNAVRVISRG